jgi:RNA polymerase sigma-70 factor (ECF subfamily)
MREPNAVLVAAQAGDTSAFEQLVAPYRRELKAHCYRMSGSAHDAEDLLQETLVKAWRGLAGFQGRSSVRTWLYAVATSACLNAAEQRRARVLPSELGPPSAPGAPGPTEAEVPWLEPYPDAWIEDEERSPEARYSRRQSVTLAFLAALQRLPPRQRAVLLLRDVLGWQASECAALLETSIAAVNSALQRARETLEAAKGGLVDAPRGEDETLLRRYLQAWERSDVAALVQLLREDAVLTMPPLPAWFRGAADIGRAIGEMVLTPGSAGLYRLVPVRANAQLAAAMYRGPEPVSVHVLTIESGEISRIDAFLDPGLVELVERA